MSRPLEARERASALLLAGRATAEERTYALQALGIVARESGEVSTAIALLRRGVAESGGARLPARRADLLASLGTALAIAGRGAPALRAFDDALGSVRGAAAARVLVRRCAVLLMLDRDEAAYADARRAATTLARAGDTLWEARARSNAAHALLGLGRFADAEREYARAQRLAEQEGQDYDAALVLHSRADCAYRLGDLPRSLDLLYAARDRLAGLGVVPADTLRDLAKVLLAAGLVPEAVAAAESLVAALDADRAAAGARADGLVVAATAYLAGGDPAQATRLAARAAQSYRRQGHAEGERHARLVQLQARAAQGHPSRRLARSAALLAGELRDRHAAERLDALLLAGRLSRDAGLPDTARECWEAARPERRRGSALRRSAGWLAEAGLAELDGDRRRLLHGCDRGLDVLDAHSISLGSTELRARATEHGRELAAMATREVLASGSPRELLRWTERWRARVLEAPPVRPADDPDDVRDLAVLREIALRSAQTGSERGQVPALDRERARVEERIRRRAHRREGAAAGRGEGFHVEELLASLGGTTLVTVTRVDGVAHVLVAAAGRVRRFAAAPTTAIEPAIEHARFMLRTAALGGGRTAAAMTAALETQAGVLEGLLLGPAVRALGDGPVVVVPPARLQAIPWDALPALRDRPVSVSPSASAWLRSRRAPRPRGRRVALLGGPRLGSAGAEVPELAKAYPSATVLRGDGATCEAALAALDGAWLGHVAAHGTIRTDNPMFSALELGDGPLTVYDLERLRRAPHRLVLSVCESAVGSATGADELLGLSSALIGLGTAGLLASIVPVNDAATVPFSLTVHERLRAGDDLATALAAARQAAAGDPLARATAYSFLALGGA